MIDPRTGLLLTGCACFGILILAEVAAGTGGGGTSFAASQRGPDTRVVVPLAAPNVEAVIAASLARPLFNPSRRPPSVSGGPADTALADKRLAGIVIEPQRRIAIFEVKGAKPLTVIEGDEVGGWRIETIAPGQVSVRGPGGTMILEPKPEGSGQSVPGVSPASAAPPASRPGAAAKPPVPLLNRRDPE